MSLKDEMNKWEADRHRIIAELDRVRLWRGIVNALILCAILYLIVWFCVKMVGMFYFSLAIGFLMIIALGHSIARGIIIWRRKRNGRDTNG